MTEDQIERWVERAYDALDKEFMATSMTQEEYDCKSLAIAKKAEEMEVNS